MHNVQVPQRNTQRQAFAMGASRASSDYRRTFQLLLLLTHRPSTHLPSLHADTGDRPYKCQHCGDQFARRCVVTGIFCGTNSQCFWKFSSILAPPFCFLPPNSDLLSRHVNKCHAAEKPPTTTTPSNRRKGPTAASRATTSKQACDQCVQSSLPCDGCNPCCTYLNLHHPANFLTDRILIALPNWTHIRAYMRIHLLTLYCRSYSLLTNSKVRSAQKPLYLRQVPPSDSTPRPRSSTAHCPPSSPPTRPSRPDLIRFHLGLNSIYLSHPRRFCTWASSWDELTPGNLCSEPTCTTTPSICIGRLHPIRRIWYPEGQFRLWPFRTRHHEGSVQQLHGRRLSRPDGTLSCPS